jgi:stearoyl-CoA desaturase (delta-9 desaturase)
VSLGFLNVSWWVPFAYFAVGAHLSNACTSIYLHRSITHRALELSPIVAFPMRLWLWLSTGVNTREWVACHRKHHAHADREEDPHSPVNSSVLAVLFGGWGQYRRAVADADMVQKYGKGVPADWWERNVFGKHTLPGLLLLLGLDLVLLGWAWGATVWAVQLFHMPLQGGIVNGIGHGWGYRNFDTKDHSTNLFPFGLWIAGEELHNNHHADPKAACFRKRWFEVDTGWVYVRVLENLGLATSVHRGTVVSSG